MYAKIIGGVVEKYPYTFADLRIEYRNTSFPSEFDDEVLDAYNMTVVEPSPSPEITYAQMLAEGTPELVGGVWRQTWLVTNKSAEEVAAVADRLRADAYREESDPLFFKAQRGEATMQQWLDKVAEIKARYPSPE